MDELLRLLKEGFEVRIGSHVDNRNGYFVGVTENECIADDDDGWDSVGHGFTVEEALINAELVAKGQEPKMKYSLSNFDEGDWEDDYDWEDFDEDDDYGDDYYDDYYEDDDYEDGTYD